MYCILIYLHCPFVPWEGEYSVWSNFINITRNLEDIIQESSVSFLFRSFIWLLRYFYVMARNLLVIALSLTKQVVPHFKKGKKENGVIQSQNQVWLGRSCEILDIRNCAVKPLSSVLLNSRISSNVFVLLSCVHLIVVVPYIQMWSCVEYVGCNVVLVL